MNTKETLDLIRSEKPATGRLLPGYDCISREKLRAFVQDHRQTEHFLTGQDVLNLVEKLLDA